MPGIPVTKVFSPDTTLEEIYKWARANTGHNQDISAKIIDSGFEYASIRVNNCTSEHFLCFSNEPYGGIRYTRQGLENKGNVSINSKPIVEYLTEALRLTFADGRAMLWISDNLSKIDQILTFKIYKRHE